jgi:hypothetical protein
LLPQNCWCLRVGFWLIVPYKDTSCYLPRLVSVRGSMCTPPWSHVHPGIGPLAAVRHGVNLGQGLNLTWQVTFLYNSVCLGRVLNPNCICLQTFCCKLIFCFSVDESGAAAPSAEAAGGSPGHPQEPAPGSWPLARSLSLLELHLRIKFQV